MTQPSDPNAPIRITDADANSSHVDDLLRRQASLRGDTGISRDTGRKWYYQNWFVLMLAGLLAAIGSWALIEPLITDMPYLEGTLKEVTPGQLDGGRAVVKLTIGNNEFIVFDETKSRMPSGKWQKLDLESMKPGDRVGLYIEWPEEPEMQQATLEGKRPKIVDFLVPNPPPSKATDDLKSSLQDRQLGFSLFFPVAAGMVGLLIGAADGIMCRLPRRILIAGGIGLIAGLVGGFISSMFANLIYGLMHQWTMANMLSAAGRLSTNGFLVQIGARGLGWAMAGIAMGLGQGLALRSGKILMYGFLGGLLGGLFGGLLFDPIAFWLSGGPSALWSRLASLSVIGLSVGLMIGIVELLARDAWLRMVAGPLAGKEFLIFKNTMQVGASPKSDIYLFNDAGVAPAHATIRATGDQYEVEATSGVYPLTVNNRAVQRCRLRHGDQIGLGRTVFVFQRKRG